MNLRDISINDEASTDIVQFIKHLEENLDPNEEFNSDVWLETVNKKEVGKLPGSDIPRQRDRPETEQYGVHIYIEFTQNSDCPNHRFTSLVRDFFGRGNYVINGGFDGGMGEYNGYVFLEK